jgi:hypothetical protein
MIRLKITLIAFIFAVAISSIQFWMAIRFSNEILWQVKLMFYIVGPGPILGYENGQPLYEGTPIHMVAAYVGLGLGVVVYWIVSYWLIKKWHSKVNNSSFS